jgi:hypothetical protein
MKALLATIAMIVVAPSLYAASNLRITAALSEDPVRAGLPFAPGFLVQNLGPDIAKNAVLTTNANTAPLSLGDIGVRNQRPVSVTVTAPLTAGPFAVTATVSSDTEDADPSDNIATRTVTVSTNPDLTVFLRAPVQQDLALPFTLSIFVGNASAFDAHDVDITVNFRPDVDVLSLPSGCSSVAAGRIVCHVATVAAQRPQVPALFTPTFYAPHAYGNGSILFTASVTEREPDFDPASNTKTTQSRLYDTFYVSTTANDGAGSLRQAILDANADCPGHEPCLIAFRISEPSETPWKTIRISSLLPAITAAGLRIDGSIQTAFFGDANPDGPEIEISGGGTVDGDGLLITQCFSEVANLAISGFLRNAISVTGTQEGCTGSPPLRELHHLFLGSDPTGSSARPNGRGIATAIANGASFYGAALSIHDCVISGNTDSGIFGTSGLLNITNNRIGVKAHADEPLPNGRSGVFIGPGGYRSNVGPEVFIANLDPATGGNVIAFNGESGVAVATGVAEVSIRNNRIWANQLLGIDIGQDGPTMSSPADSGDPISIPTLTLAHYDPVSNKTIVEGTLPTVQVSRFFNFKVNLYASDSFNPSGFGEGQRPLGATIVSVPGSTFRFEADGNLSGQWITATNTRDQVFQSQTTEFSRAIPAQGPSFAPWRRRR